MKILLELAKLAIRNYELPDDVAVRLACLSENATFCVGPVAGQHWALRVHRPGYHSKAEIASELAWLTDLRETGVAITPRPVKGKTGELIQEIAHPVLSVPRFVVLTQWEEGIEPGIDQNLIKPFELLGEITARMHAHARSWKKPAFFTRFTWDFETSLGEDKPHWGRWRDGLGVDDGKNKLFGRTAALIRTRLNSFGQGKERFGLIHGDLRLANLLIDGNSVKVIDFDDCGFGWYLYDAATPISFYEHEPQVPELIEAWKQGFRRVAPLSAPDENEIPTFIMLRRLLLVAWIGSHSETELAKSKGVAFTEATMSLCESYLSRFG